jgi:hypothetical protein
MSKEQVLQDLDEITHYRFNDMTICWETVQGKGAAGFAEGNKRQALLGDALLRSQLLRKWYLTGQTTGKSGREIAPSEDTCLVTC